MDAKRALRREIKALRDGLGADARQRIDAAIADNVSELAPYALAPVVFTYLSAGSEVDTRGIIRNAWANGKTVAIPRCVPGSRLMEWHVIESFEGLEKGSLGIDEPPANPATLIDPSQQGPLSVALVPALSYDPYGFRLGYGGGYYDTFLPSFPGVSIGLCRNAQLSTAPLPTDLHDAPVSFVVTETGVL